MFDSEIKKKPITFKPQTARKSSLQGLPVTERTVNGMGAEERRERVNFFFVESACLRRALN